MLSSGPYSNDIVWNADLLKLRIEEFGDSCLVFDKVSGDTHILNFLTISLVRYLSKTPSNLNDLYGPVLNSLELSKEDCSIGLMEDSLKHLDNIGLIQPQIGLE